MAGLKERLAKVEVEAAQRMAPVDWARVVRQVAAMDRLTAPGPDDQATAVLEENDCPRGGLVCRGKDSHGR